MMSSSAWPAEQEKRAGVGVCLKVSGGESATVARDGVGENGGKRVERAHELVALLAIGYQEVEGGREI